MSEELIAKNRELEEKVARLEDVLKKQARRRNRLISEAVGWGSLLLVGPGLHGSFRKWFETASRSNPVPPEETAGVLAAVVRRVVGVGALTVLLAVVPTVVATGFYIWHTALLQRQIDQQAADTLIVRRAQLLAPLYEEDKESCEEVAIEGADPPRIERQCQPLATARAREEAAKAFIAIERSRSIAPDLSGALLSGVRLARTDLSSANLSEASLVGADLSEASLVGADLSQADLSQADLFGADLSQAILSGADLSQADLVGADLPQAYLVGADLSQADLVRADLSNTILSEADLSEADLSEASLVGADLSEAILRRADLSEASLLDVDLSKADLSKAILSGADLSEADLEVADLYKAYLRGADLYKAYLYKAYLLEADLSQAYLLDADLSEASLVGADLSEAILRRADLSEASLLDVDLSKADLSEADLRSSRYLTQSQIDQASGDGTTTLPEGLSHPGHWAKGVERPNEAKVQ